MGRAGLVPACSLVAVADKNFRDHPAARNEEPFRAVFICAAMEGSGNPASYGATDAFGLLGKNKGTQGRGVAGTRRNSHRRLPLRLPASAAPRLCVSASTFLGDESTP